MKMFQISIKDYTQYNIKSRYIFVLQFHCMAVFQLYFDSFPLFKQRNSNRTIFFMFHIMQQLGNSSCVQCESLNNVPYRHIFCCFVIIHFK